MAAPTFDSVSKAATQSAPTVSHYVKAYSAWVKHTIMDPKNGHKTGAASLGLAVDQFIDYAQKGADLHTKKFKASMNVR